MYVFIQASACLSRLIIELRTSGGDDETLQQGAASPAGYQSYSLLRLSPITL